MRDNVNKFGNSSDPIGSAVYLALFGPSTAAALGGGIATLPYDVNGDIAFVVAGISSETMGVTLSDDGTNYSAAIIPIDVTTGLPAASADLAAGSYVIRLEDFGTPRYVKFTKSSTSETGTVAFAAPRASINF